MKIHQDLEVDNFEIDDFIQWTLSYLVKNMYQEVLGIQHNIIFCHKMNELTQNNLIDIVWFESTKIIEIKDKFLTKKEIKDKNLIKTNNKISQRRQAQISVNIRNKEAYKLESEQEEIRLKEYYQTNLDIQESVRFLLCLYKANQKNSDSIYIDEYDEFLTAEGYGSWDYNDMRISKEDLVYTKDWEKNIETIIILLDKYSDNQDGDLNLRYIIYLNQVASTELPNDKLGMTRLLNPNILETTDLLGILGKKHRKNYLELYSYSLKNNDWSSLIEFIARMYSDNLDMINQLNIINLDFLPLIYNNCTRLAPLDSIIDDKTLIKILKLEIKQYLILFDLLVVKLKLKEITLTDFYLLLSSNPLSKEIINQIKGLDSFLLNIELDGKDQDSGIIFDSNRWDFIYHWIEQARNCVIKD